MRTVTRADRLSSLLEMLVSDGRIDVEHSASHFGVSAATIRRDLDYLADQQLLSRTHGGAVPNTTSYDLPLRYKSSSRGEAKLRIAERAVGMLWPGCTLALNGVTVVTNAINIATELTVRPFIKIVVCGGVARPQSYELVGALATETLGQLTPDICFLGAIGVDPAAGITTYDEAEAAINRVMVTQAKRTVVVADASKLGHVGFSRICHVNEVSAIITDTSAAPEMVATLEARGVEVILA
jgi:DeoR family transcriptional regulator of aga operon